MFYLQPPVFLGRGEAFPVVEHRRLRRRVRTQTRVGQRESNITVIIFEIT